MTNLTRPKIKPKRTSTKRRTGKPGKNTPPYIYEIIKKSINGHNRQVGILVGRINDDGIFCSGWSRVNINGGDRFNKDYGLKLALERTHATKRVPHPPSINDDFWKFIRRCGRYFKTEMEG